MLEERDSLFIDRLLPALLIALMTIFLAVFEWIRFAKDSPPAPVLFSTVAVASIAYLEPKALPAFLEKAQRRLSTEDVKLATFHLSRFIRASERERAFRTAT